MSAFFYLILRMCVTVPTLYLMSQDIRKAAISLNFDKVQATTTQKYLDLSLGLLESVVISIDEVNN